MTNRLALGTAQFGGVYGVANRSGEVSDTELSAILQTARSSGIDVCDTAALYGRAEERLGAAGVDGWKIVTKLPALPEGVDDVAAWLDASLAASLTRLRQPSLWGLLLHRSADLRGPRAQALIGALQSVRQRGVVHKIGLSVYSPGELDALWSSTFDLVQAPLNVFDRRLQTSGWLDRLERAGVEVHARSVFLQGVLVMPASMRHSYFSRWSALFERWSAWLAETGVDPVKACLDLALAHRGVWRVVVGVETRSQLQQLIDAAGAPRTGITPDQFAVDDVDLLEPYRWDVH
jgi:aryl-alcohol dehydrogenase-like predicted oxidoreductase